MNSQVDLASLILANQLSRSDPIRPPTTLSLEGASSSARCPGAVGVTDDPSAKPPLQTTGVAARQQVSGVRELPQVENLAILVHGENRECKNVECKARIPPAA